MIFDFSDYRAYLQEYLRRLPNQGHGEARKIAQHLNVSSTFISHIFSGVKYLTQDQALVLSEYLGHSEMEAQYFFYLVQHERAGTERLKKYCVERLKEIKTKSLKLVNRVEAERVLSDEEKSIFYSSPLYSAFHLYASTNPKGLTLEEISQRFGLTRSKVSIFINFLVGAGLLVEKESRYVITTRSTHVEASSPHALKHHANWRLRAIQNSEELTDKELMYTVNISLSKTDFDLLREQMVAFIKKFLDKVHASPAEEIACFNMDFFWIKR